MRRKSEQAGIAGRQYERFLPAVGLAIDFSDRECLSIVTDYQAATNEFDSRSTTVKRRKKPPQNNNPALISPLLIVRMNNSPVWKQDMEGGKCKRQPLIHIPPKPHHVIVARKIFLHTPGATI